jgi:ubiquinone/menaquinone biosynthesis C-methylase UbiE
MSQEHWESYYRGGALASCPLGLEPGYTGDLRDAWVAFFSALPDGAQILDIGTGNGAIPLIAVETAAALGRSCVIDGIDLAQIDPVRYVRNGERLFAGVRFHGGVAAESLPFRDQTIDAVTAQYALEFTDVPRTLAEVHRVARPGACCLFVLHHADSVLVQNAAESLAHADFLLDDLKIFRKFRRYLDAEQEDPAKATGPWRQLVLAGDELQKAAGGARQSLTLTTMLDSLRQLFELRKTATPLAVRTVLDRMETDLRASVRRMQGVQSAAQSREDIESLVATAAAGGFHDIHFEAQLFRRDLLVGWRVSLRRQ